MARVQLEKGEQARFLRAVKDRTGLAWQRIAEVCQVERHTLQAWRKEEWRMSYRALVRLSRLSGVPMPRIIEKISEEERRRRAGRKGATRVQELYGNPGTPEGRSKGGRISQQRRQERPELYNDNFIIRQPISLPQYSPQLAELVGIVLGDGGITPLQVAVTLNGKEIQYAQFVATLFRELFDAPATISVDERDNTRTVRVSRVAVVEFLESIGLQRGDKVRNQVSIPQWIFAEKSYMKACLRGLMDTDGSIYPETKMYKGKEYRYVNLCFTSYSSSLTEGVDRMLRKLGFRPTVKGNRQVFLRRQIEVEKYVQEVGIGSPERLERYKQLYEWKTTKE